MIDFNILDPSHRDENNVIHYIHVSASIVDISGSKSYTVNVSRRQATVLKETDEKIQLQFTRVRRTFNKNKLRKNEYGNVIGVNEFGIGSSLKCAEKDIDEAIQLCINDLWKKVAKRKDVPEWVHKYSNKSPEINRYVDKEKE